MQQGQKKRKIRKPQHQKRPGSETKMQPVPVFDYPQQAGNNKLFNKIALITGGDSGIGKAVAILFAKEGADIAISYLNEKKDAEDTATIIKHTYQRKCLLIPGDVSKEKHCKAIINKVIREYSKLNILVNNAALQYENKKIEDLTAKELIKTFETNIFSYFWLTKAALPHLKKNACIINSSSVTAYRGSAGLMDYSASKGAIVSFTRSLSANLAKKGIRVNGV
jgi:NAD(P)-dependent dehydrogenase (short-subunit alcohol dehydrogenase family)